MVLVNPSFCPDCGAATTLASRKPAEPPRAYCAPCDRVHYTGPRLAAGVLARVPASSGGDALVFVRRGIEPGYGLWVYPGGFVDDGESPEVAAVREAREEAGVEVRVERLLGVYHHAPRNVVVVVYVGAVVGGELSARDESLEVAAWRPAEIDPRALAFDTTRAAVSDYQALVGHPAQMRAR